MNIFLKFNFRKLFSVHKQAAWRCLGTERRWGVYQVSGSCMQALIRKFPNGQPTLLGTQTEYIGLVTRRTETSKSEEKKQLRSVSGRQRGQKNLNSLEKLTIEDDSLECLILS